MYSLSLSRETEFVYMALGITPEELNRRVVVAYQAVLNI